MGKRLGVALLLSALAFLLALYALDGWWRFVLLTELAAVTVVYLWWWVRLEGAADAKRRELPGLALWIGKVGNSDLPRWLARISANELIPALFALTLFALFLYGLNRVFFAVEDAGGWICESGGPLKAIPEEGATLLFELHNACQPSGFVLVARTKYLVEIKDAKGWKYGNIDVQPDLLYPYGFWTPWRAAPHLLLAVPMRRLLREPWFAPVVRVGSIGTQNYVLQAGTNVIEPRDTGELFFYVNDAVSGFGLWDSFYRNNEGAATVYVQRP